MFIVSLFVLVGLCYLYKNTRNYKASNETSEADYHWVAVKFSDHLWVKYGDAAGSTILHHPDCPCGWMKKGIDKSQK